MSSNIKTMSSQAAPWSKQVAWWLIVLEGVVALLLGLFMLFRPDQASVRFLQLIGAYLVATSVIAIYRIVAHKEEVAGEPGRWVRVGISLVVGLIALLQPRMPTIDAAAAATVLAVGLLLVGVMGIYAAIATRAQGGMRWGVVIVNAIYLLFAFAVFAQNRGNTDTSGQIMRWVGILALIAGAGLIFYGIRRRSEEAAALAAAAAVQTPPAAGEQPALGAAAAPTSATGAPAAPAAPTDVPPTSTPKPPANGAG